MGYVYLARNRINDKRYVGKTVGNLAKRISKHQSLSKHKCGSSIFLKALAKYGPESFEWTVLFEDDDAETLLEVEKVMIAMLRTKSPRGYNLTNGGEGHAGFSLPIESREKIRLALTGRKRGPLSSSQRAKMSLALKGRRHSAETCAKISASSMGKKMPLCKPETRQKLSSAMIGKRYRKGQTVSPETRAKLSAVKMGHKVGLKTREKIRNKLLASWIRRKQCAMET